MPHKIPPNLAPAFDATLLMRRAGMTPDPWQADVLRCSEKQMLLLCGRQTGKSTTTAVLALHRAIYWPGSLVLLLSPGLRQSKELFRKVLQTFDRLPDRPRVLKRSAVELELVNGSRIVSLPASEETIRGYSGAALLVIDEASRVPEDLYAAVRPMLATSSGRIVCLSTPFGTQGFFYEAFENGGPEWRRFIVTAEQCPRISKEFLAQERRTVDERCYAQEYLCQFFGDVSRVFDRRVVMAAFDPNVLALSWE